MRGGVEKASRSDPLPSRIAASLGQDSNDPESRVLDCLLRPDKTTNGTAGLMMSNAKPLT
jgi:hypothetical protein